MREKYFREEGKRKERKREKKERKRGTGGREELLVSDSHTDSRGEDG